MQRSMHTLRPRMSRLAIRLKLRKVQLQYRCHFIGNWNLLWTGIFLRYSACNLEEAHDKLRSMPDAPAEPQHCISMYECYRVSHEME